MVAEPSWCVDPFNRFFRKIRGSCGKQHQNGNHQHKDHLIQECVSQPDGRNGPGVQTEKALLRVK